MKYWTERNPEKRAKLKAEFERSRKARTHRGPRRHRVVRHDKHSGVWIGWHELPYHDEKSEILARLFVLIPYQSVMADLQATLHGDVLTLKYNGRRSYVSKFSRPINVFRALRELEE